jgi:ABC-type oligopeptide transport system substrate-binding subunit
VGPGPFPLHGDVNAARRLVRTSRARPPIAVSLWYVDGQPATEELAKRAKEGLDAAGFAVRLRPIRNSLIYASAERSLVPMDMTVGGWGEDFPDAVTVIPKLLGTGSPWNYSHYASARADRLTARMAQRPYGPARRQAWTALGDLLARGDAPLVVYGNGTTARLHSDRVGNVVLSYAKAGVDYSLLTLAP